MPKSLARSCPSLITFAVDTQSKSYVSTFEYQTVGHDIDVRVICLHDPGEDGERRWTSTASSQEADHLLSDAVFFIASSVSSLTAIYLSWVNVCGGAIAMEQIKPIAYICWPESWSSGGVIGGWPHDAFQALTILPYTEHKGISFKTLVDVAFQGRQYRREHGHLWTRHDYTTIRRALKLHKRSLTNTQFSIANSITAKHDRLLARGDFCNALISPSSQQLMAQSVPLLASYLAHHARVSCRWEHWPRECLWRTDRRNHFTRHHFNVQYRPHLEAMLRAVGSKHTSEVGAVLDAIYTAWRKCLKAAVACATPAVALEMHLRRVRSHADFLQRQEFGLSCSSCLSRDWRAMLPCARHGLCEVCLRQLDGDWRKNGQANIDSCKICNVRRDGWSIPIQPPTARGRILSLDGGGVRGLVQLEILALIEEKTALSLPIRRFFDLIVGTSVGGIVALGLGVNAWTVDTCRDRLLALSREVFGQQSRGSRVMSHLTGGWWPLISRITRIWTNSAIYSADVLESVLKSAFGEHEPLLGTHCTGPHVAITASTPSDPPSELFTTYNKSSHPDGRFYGWHQRPPQRRAVKVWETARCTSAAPFYFPAKTIEGTTFHDGGMLHNNPAGIARREGGLLFSCDPKENLLVSIGCGEMRFVPYGDHLFGRVLNAACHLSNPAEEERKQAELWGQPHSNYVRLDPQLEVESIGLDDIETMSALQSKIRNCIRDDEEMQSKALYCAWLLIAGTFFCDLSSDEEDSFEVMLCCRLGDEVAHIFQCWPSAYFLITEGEHRSYRLDHTKLPHLLQLRMEVPEAKINITFVHDKLAAPISGFPCTVAALQASIEDDSHLSVSPRGVKRKHGQ